MQWVSAADFLNINWPKIRISRILSTCACWQTRPTLRGPRGCPAASAIRRRGASRPASYNLGDGVNHVQPRLLVQDPPESVRHPDRLAWQLANDLDDAEADSPVADDLPLAQHPEALTRAAPSHARRRVPPGVEITADPAPELFRGPTTIFLAHRHRSRPQPRSSRVPAQPDERFAALMATARIRRSATDARRPHPLDGRAVAWRCVQLPIRADGAGFPDPDPWPAFCPSTSFPRSSTSRSCAPTCRRDANPILRQPGALVARRIRDRLPRRRQLLRRAQAHAHALDADGHGRADPAPPTVPRRKACQTRCMSRCSGSVS